MRILVVEDQKKIASFIEQGLSQHGFVVDVCHTGEEGFYNATTESYDAMVMDVMLPGRDGLSILKSLREKGLTLPVLILTARSELNERVQGLNAGADDYLTKPFYVEELVARMHALLRRATGTPASVLKSGPLTLDLLTREVRRDTEVIELSAREFSLLEYFMRSPGRVLTRSQIGQHVWNLHFDTGSNMVDVAIGRLRRKIEIPNGRLMIETVRGAGYKFKEAKA
ncbi:MAG: response regulator with CheY-like receiver domain and winged-helix DNA-binding domain [Verrucomicrobiaceae bacterium]|nr:response regulator with CheY-like receiver domain and winged-helix DNA-binding domain [Verrucomicrobiaceae bacterium]